MRKNIDVPKAMKDPEYRDSLSAAEQDSLPENPAGLMEISEDDLEFVVGGLAADPQTGTGAPDCSCELTETANSGGGRCWCVCEVEPEEDPGTVA